MDATELERLALMERIAVRSTTQVIVAKQLGLTLRQVERLYARFKAGGAEGLVSRKRGARSNYQLEPDLRMIALALIRSKYADFGPTLAHEKLVEVHHLAVSLTTVRGWMLDDGVWTTRRDRDARAYQPRYRRACFGELVQIDGCLHPWFEDRAPKCAALVYVDDATSRMMELRFVLSESTFDYFASTRSYMLRHGKPVALYSDKAGVFRVNAKEPKSGDGFTQFGRAMHELNVDLICANSAPAKGRVERAHQTLQDRLVKELRLRDISSMDDANDYAPAFMEDYNRRFGRTPQSDHDAHRPLLKHEQLDRVFTWQEERRVTSNLTFNYKRTMFVLVESKASRAAAGKQILVREASDGELAFEYLGNALPARAFVKDARVTQGDIADNKLLGPVLEEIQRRQLARDAETTKRLSLREESQLMKAAGVPGLAARRGPGRPSIRTLALERMAREAAEKALGDNGVC